MKEERQKNDLVAGPVDDILFRSLHYARDFSGSLTWDIAVSILDVSGEKNHKNHEESPFWKGPIVILT